jgi:hypothetical protein
MVLVSNLFTLVADYFWSVTAVMATACHTIPSMSCDRSVSTVKLGLCVSKDEIGHGFDIISRPHVLLSRQEAGHQHTRDDQPILGTNDSLRSMLGRVERSKKRVGISSIYGLPGSIDLTSKQRANVSVGVLLTLQISQYSFHEHRFV